MPLQMADEEAVVQAHENEGVGYNPTTYVSVSA